MQAAIDGSAFIPKTIGDATIVQANPHNKNKIESPKRKARGWTVLSGLKIVFFGDFYLLCLLESIDV